MMGSRRGLSLLGYELVGLNGMADLFSLLFFGLLYTALLGHLVMIIKGIYLLICN